MLLKTRLALVVISRQTFRQLFVFGIIGVLATITHYVVAITINETIHLNIYMANLLGYSVAVFVSFIGHGKLTFQVALNHMVFIKFVVVSISAFLSSEMLLALMEQYLRLPHRISMLVVVAVIPVLSFIFNKFWVYRVAN